MISPLYQRENFTLQDTELRDALLPLLREQIFHVTSHDRFQLIEETGRVSANSDGALGNTFPQSARSFARQKGYVCLFDLRNKSDEAIESALSNFYFLAPHPLGDDLVFLTLRPENYTGILYWENVASTAGPAAFRIPYVECWYPTDLPLSSIHRALFLHVDWRPHPSDSMSSLLLAAHEELVRRGRGI